MNKHTDTTRPVDAPTDHAARYGRHSTRSAWERMGDLPKGPAPTWNDPWAGDPDTDRYWAHNND